MVAIPHSAEEITADWLRAAVRAEEAATFSNLISLSVEPLAEATAGTADVCRLNLDYAAGASAGPTTLFAKLPSSSPGIREVARGWNTYAREMQFYREIAATVALRIPRHYVAEFDPKTQAFVLVMEDLHPAKGDNQVDGLSLDHVRLALDEIAGLHASWWERPELKALETTTIQPFGEGLWVGTGLRHAAAWPACELFLAGRASLELRRIGERMAGAIEPMMVDMAKGARTLCHGDFRADNMLFAPDGGLITIDWQAPLQARGAFDVGYMMAMSVTVDLRRTHETRLLRGYYDRLLAGGVENYGYDEFFHDYRRGLLIGFTYFVQACPAAQMTHPMVAALYENMVRRVDAAVQDHGLGEFVD